MEKATEIFEKHWIKRTGKPLDEMTKAHMNYAIEAVNEALNQSAVSGALPEYVKYLQDRLENWNISFNYYERWKERQ